MPELKTNTWRKYTSSNVTSDDSAPTEMSTTLPSHYFDCHGHRSARIRFFGDADNATFTDITIFFIYTSRSSNSVVAYHTKQFAILNGTIRCGSVTGVAGGNASASEFYVGLVGTLTVSAWGQKLLNHVAGIADVHNVDDEIGELLISDICNADYIHLQFDVGTATSVNAEVHLDV